MKRYPPISLLLPRYYLVITLLLPFYFQNITPILAWYYQSYNHIHPINIAHFKVSFGFSSHTFAELSVLSHKQTKNQAL